MDTTQKRYESAARAERITGHLGKARELMIEAEHELIRAGREAEKDYPANDEVVLALVGSTHITVGALIHEHNKWAGFQSARAKAL